MKGIFSALLVPFDENGSLDENGLRDIIQYNINIQGVDGLYVGGSTGENFMLSKDSKMKIFKIVYEEVNNQVPLIAQIGGLNFYESIELAKYVTYLGYNYISAITPFYYKFTFEEIKSYYQKISQEINNNIIIYSIPMMTGVDITISEFSQLLNIKNVVGIKYTSNDLFLLEQIRTLFPKKLIYSGYDEVLLPALTLGVDGAIGSTYNINAIRAKYIYHCVENGDLNKARELQSECNSIISCLLKDSLFQSLKEILKQKGVNAGVCHPPFLPINIDRCNELKKMNEKYLP